MNRALSCLRKADLKYPLKKSIIDTESKLSLYSYLLSNLQPDPHPISVGIVGLNNPLFTLVASEELRQTHSNFTFSSVDRSQSMLEINTNLLIEFHKPTFNGETSQLQTFLSNFYLASFDPTQEWLPKSPFHLLFLSFSFGSDVFNRGFLVHPNVETSRLDVYQKSNEKIGGKAEVFKTGIGEEYKLVGEPDLYIPGVELEEKDEAEKNAEMERNLVKKQLEDWKQGFIRKYGRSPNREDLMLDGSAREMFIKFSKLNKLS
eukprot:maker-scaffold_37-snap-gene-2.10-mRNA-1 protein AED:0.06 eAED:0.06 QI:0/0/0/1/1/1/2/0/260